MLLLRARPLLPLAVGLSFGLATSTLPLLRRPLRLDSPGWTYSEYQQNAKTPITTASGKLNPSAVRQVSMGSITGVVAGLAVSTFSKSLALLVGLLVFGVQALESRGIHIVPYGRLQKYFTNLDLRSAVQDNAAFKLSFGATFAMVGFLDF